MRVAAGLACDFRVAGAWRRGSRALPVPRRKKFLLVGEGGKVLHTVSESYEVKFPHPGWSQQSPEDWRRALTAGIPRLLEGQDVRAVRGIGTGGQMHGLVALDAADAVIRPCILWNDGRTERQTRWLNEHVGRELGLPDGVVVCAGAGDNAAAAVGCGAVAPGTCNISLGTSGTVFIPSERFRVDERNALHAFDYVDGTYHLMGCILSAASCNAWWLKRILGTDDYEGELGTIDASVVAPDQPFFLPYLMGERSPHNDPDARGAFVGLRMDTSRAEMTRAVLEGVSFAIRDCVEVARAQGIDVRTSTVCGGGAKSVLWRQMLADVLGVTLRMPQTEQGPGYGAALLAAVACGAYPSVAAASEAVVRMRGKVAPNPALADAYAERYHAWLRLYPALCESFPRSK